MTLVRVTGKTSRIGDSIGSAVVAVAPGSRCLDFERLNVEPFKLQASTRHV